MRAGRNNQASAILLSGNNSVNALERLLAVTGERRPAQLPRERIQRREPRGRTRGQRAGVVTSGDQLVAYELRADGRFEAWHVFAAEGRVLRRMQFVKLRKEDGHVASH